MTGRYARHSKIMTIANRLVKQGCNRANPHRHALIMKNWQKRLKHRKNKTARKTPKSASMRLLLGANEGIRTPDLLITNHGLFCISYYCYIILLKKYIFEKYDIISPQTKR